MRIARPRPMSGFRVVREGPVRYVTLPDTPIRSPRDVVELLGPLYEDEDVEVFGFLPLNVQHNLIQGPIIVTRGILDASLVHPREVFRAAFKLHDSGPAALILFHNHPSGDPSPSPDDRTVTAQLVAAGRLLDVPVHDHIIIGRGRYVSFAEAGLM